MKTELEQQDIEAIAQRIIELLKPVLSAKKSNSIDEILDMNGASEFLKVSREQIYQWVSNAKHGLGNFPYKKLGKQLRFSKKELNDWMETNKSR